MSRLLALEVAIPASLISDHVDLKELKVSEICTRVPCCATSPQRVGGPFSKREIPVSRLHDSTFDLCARQVNLVLIMGIVHRPSSNL